jgi:hypothetical protein
MAIRIVKNSVLFMPQTRELINIRNAVKGELET